MALLEDGPLFPRTKFMAPPLRPEHVHRARCHAEVSDGWARHVLVSAPAGSGKSTFAAQWAAASGRVAWVSLAPDDDEPGQFWAAVFSGLGGAVPQVGALLPPLLGGTAIDRLLIDLVNLLIQEPEDVVLVLDDLHLISTPDALDGLGWLIENAPAQLRIAICTRVDPPLALDRLLVGGTLGQVAYDQLRFDAGEASELLVANLGLELAPAEVAGLAEGADGWAAGIYLAALSLRGGVPAAEITESLTHGNRRVQEYFLGEVIAALDPDTLTFLEGVSVLDRFSAPPCDAVLQRTDSASVLDELDRSNLFVILLDTSGTWRRLHHLLGAVLRERAEHLCPDELRARHVRAAAWHEAAGNVDEAIRHYTAAGAYDDAERVISSAYPVHLNLSRMGARVARWLAALPAEVVQASAPLTLAAAWVAGFQGDQAVHEAALKRVMAHAGGLLPNGSTVAGEVALARSVFCWGDLRYGLTHAREAADALPDGSPWQPLEMCMVAHLAYLVDGDTDEALQHAERGVAFGIQHMQGIASTGCWSVLAAVHADRGNHAEAAAAATRCAELREHFMVTHVPQAAHVWAYTSHAHLLGGRIDRAVAEAEHVYDVVRDIPAELDGAAFTLTPTIQLARIRIKQGRPDEARALIAEARRRLAFAADAGRLATLLDAVEARLGAGATRRPSRDGADELSQREVTIVRMLAGTTSLKEIGDELFVSQNTMKTHCRNIYMKLGVASRGDAVAKSRELGMVP